MLTGLSLTHTTDLAVALGLRSGDVVCLVGGGGKTSLMFRLAHELAVAGEHIISTTTTRIMSPAPEESECIILEEDAKTLVIRARDALLRYRHITLAHPQPDADKLKGLLPEMVDHLHRLGLANYIVNEADGAACLPLKAPNLTEPVIPSSTSLVIAMVGIEAIGRPLLPENAFRVDNISRLTGLKEGEPITLEAVSLLITHPQGIIQHAMGARIIPFINKVGEDQVTRAEALAVKILCRRHPRIEKVVYGEVRRPAYPLTIASLKTDESDGKH
ncbi:MAG: selenium cofactor biosynthesis protein YqeC [Dehalococcoidia bacterium]|nr:selenium cofactor biosynthesis protein YqeC [Dehalococcoidia bacterium]